MYGEPQPTHERLLFALKRLYIARLDLLGLDSLRNQETLLSGKLGTKNPLFILERYPLRSFVTTLALVFAGLSFQHFFVPTVTDYWRAAVFGVLSFWSGALAWAFYVHDRRVKLLSQRLLGELETAATVRIQIDQAVGEIEFLLTNYR
jgi:hypothetical protein